MSAGHRDGADVRIPPPVIFAASMVLGVVLELQVTELPLPLEPSTLKALAGLCLVLGVALLVIAMGLFRRSGQNPEPWKPTPEIISTGIYRYTRNPMYLGMTLIQAAVGCSRGSAWILLLIPLSLALAYLLAVRHEEAYLEQKFGQDYLEYKNSVRRWL